MLPAGLDPRPDAGVMPITKKGDQEALVAKALSTRGAEILPQRRGNSAQHLIEMAQEREALHLTLRRLVEAL